MESLSKDSEVLTFPESNHPIPTYRGVEARRELTRRWGLPWADPRKGESLFGNCRILFVDDDNDGTPVAYWVPDKED